MADDQEIWDDLDEPQEVEGNCYYCGESSATAEYLILRDTVKVCDRATCNAEHRRMMHAKGRRKWVICSDCEGEGTRVHPALSVWTAEDRADDPDGFDDMMRGEYDVSCETCGGSGKVDVYTERRRSWWGEGDPEAEAERRMGAHGFTPEL